MTMQFRDLHAQYEALKPEIDAGIAGVIDSAAFILGNPSESWSSSLPPMRGESTASASPTARRRCSCP